MDLHKAWAFLSGLVGSIGDALPPSPPRGWPDRARPEDLVAQPRRVVKVNASQNFAFRTNFVRSYRYTPATFLPLFLYESFHPLYKGANFYFLVIAILQTVSEISNTNGFPTMLGPILIILIVDGVMAVLEDVEKHEADRIANGSLTSVLQSDGTWGEPIPWMDVQVGDIIRVKNREISPADLLILAVAEPDPAHVSGLCYIETKSLDGETNLKMRQACKATLRGSLAEIRQLEATVELEHPNANMHSMDAVLNIAGGPSKFEKGDKPVAYDSVMLRGVTLRNTEWLAGLVLNTGSDTKIIMSSTERTFKQSRMEKMVNKQLIWIVALLIFVCTIAALGNVIANLREVEDHWYLYPDEVFFANSTRPIFPTLGEGEGVGTDELRDQGVNFVIMFFYYFLLFANFIPISLYVSMAIMKSGQAYFMQQDLQMYHAETDSPCQVKNMKLNEQLGQVSHIFSDKTGTLTCNVMDFRKCIIGGVQYGRGTTAIGEASASVTGKVIPDEDLEANEVGEDVGIPHVAFWDPKIWRALRGDSKGGAKHAERIENFFRVLSLCHTVTPEKDDAGGITYSASSPDDEALVYGAKYFGFYFCQRTDGAALIKVGDRLGERFAAEYIRKGGLGRKYRNSPGNVLPKEDLTHDESYELLEILEFNSTRKRMSVIVKHKESGKIWLFSKGADSVMKERLKCFETRDAQDMQEYYTTDRQLQELAEEGLRTLLVGGKSMTEAEYKAWDAKFLSASANLDQIKLRKEGHPNEIDRLMDEIEHGLELFGATAIEDRLQDEVPETIAILMKAGIKIWVLTGDKEETAINIGRACRLIKKEMELIVINEKRIEETDGSFADILTEQADDIQARLDKWHQQHDRLMRSPRHAGAFASQSKEPDEEDGEGFSHMSQARVRSRFSRNTSGELVDEEGISLRSTPEDRPSTGSRMRAASRRALQSIAATRPTFALVVDGMSLSRGLQSEEDKDKLLRLSLLCDSVVACRVSPKQKQQIVKMVQDGDSDVQSLAIGDGANDVAMIKGAHVGVGISGQEGMQAVNNSDYAIAQFKFLRRLLMVQGRYNYRRMAKAVLYIFYKNLLFTMTNFWMAFWNLMSGQKYLIEASVQLYNVFFTGVPVLLFGIWDRDVKDTSAISIPALYTPCIHNEHFNTFLFWRWIFEAILQSLIISYLPLGLLHSGDADADGNITTLWEYGAAIITLVVWTANVKIFMHQNSWTWWQFALWWLTLSTWWITGFAFEELSRQANNITQWTGDDQNFVGVFTQLMENRNFWLIFILVSVFVWGRDFIWKSYARMFRPSVYMVVQELDNNLGDPEETDEHYDNIHQKLSRKHRAARWQREKQKSMALLEGRRSRGATPTSSGRNSPSAGDHLRSVSLDSRGRFFTEDGIPFVRSRSFGSDAFSRSESAGSPPRAFSCRQLQRINSMRSVDSSGFAASYDEESVVAERSRIMRFRKSAQRAVDKTIVTPMKRLSEVVTGRSSDSLGSDQRGSAPKEFGSPFGAEERKSSRE